MIGPAVQARERTCCCRRNNLKISRIEPLGQLWPNQYLIEDVLEIVYMFGTVIKIRTRRIASCVAEMTPHGVVEETVLAALNGAYGTGGDVTRDDSIQAARSNHAEFKWIHVEIPHQHRSAVPDPVLLKCYLPGKLSAFETLTLS